MRYGASNPVRVAYAKRGKIRWISHRDVARAFERAMRIERLPVAFSAGFSPHPKVSFGLALSTGYESDAEYLDVSLTEPVELESLPARLSAALPTGLTVTAAMELADGAPALQESVTTTEWIVSFTDIDAQLLREATEALLAAESVVVTRSKKGKVVDEDVRGAIRAVAPLDGTWPASTARETALAVELCAHPYHAKPTELLAALTAMVPSLAPPPCEGLAPLSGANASYEILTAARVVRTHQWIERDGARLSPLDADAPARAEVRA